MTVLAGLLVVALTASPDAGTPAGYRYVGGFGVPNNGHELHLAEGV